MANTLVNNNTLPAYPVLRDVNAGNEQIQVVRLDVGVGTAESRLSESNPLPTLQYCVISTLNSSATNLAAGNSYTFTGVAEQSSYSDMMVNLFADQATTIQIQLSQDGTNWDSTITKQGAANANEFTTIVKGARWVRVVVTTASATTTVFRLQTQFGTFRHANTSLSASVGQDADAIVVRAIDSELDIINGKYAGYSVISKAGRNADIDAAATPEDLWNGGGVYTGFPTGSPEEIQVFSSDVGDTGSLTFSYLATSDSTEYQSATVTLTGTTPVNTGITAYRVHTANYSSGAATTFNIGNITVRHRVTTANVFIFMPAGRSQSYILAYTIPAGSIGIVKRIAMRVSKNTAATVEGGLWVRTNGGSPRIRRPFSASDSGPYQEDPYGGIPLPAKSDVTIRIFDTFGSNNVEVIGQMDILLIKQ